MISIEAYRAAIGRFHCKVRSKNKFDHPNGVEHLVLFSFVILLISTFSYVVLIGIMLALSNFLLMTFVMSSGFALTIVLMALCSLNLFSMKKVVYTLTYGLFEISGEIIINAMTCLVFKVIDTLITSNRFKLAKLFLCYYVVTNSETPKSTRGRKKKGNAFNFMKPKNLFQKDDSNEISSTIISQENIAVPSNFVFPKDDTICDKQNVEQSASEPGIIHMSTRPDNPIEDDIIVTSVSTPFQENNTDTISTTVIDIAENSSIVPGNIPVPLLNQGDNICFFNSIVQVLHSLELFCEHLCDTNLNNAVVHNMRLLFNEIDNSMPMHEPVYTFLTATELGFPNWNYGRREQIDALEFLEHILGNSFEINDRGATIHSLFKMCEHKSMMCDNCHKESRTTNDIPLYTLEIDPSNRQSISGLLNRAFDDHGYPRPHYRCEILRNESGNEIFDSNGNRQGCGLTGYCSEQVHLTVSGDFIIIHLKIYNYDDYGRKFKLFPHINIDDEIFRFDHFDLQGVIWHHGNSFNGGHYTCQVKVNEIWYNADDHKISEKSPTLEVIPDNYNAPYIIVYKRRITEVTELSLSINELEIESESVEFDIHDVNTVSDKKRTHEENIGNYDLNSTKRKKSEREFISDEEMIIDNNEQSVLIVLDDETDGELNENICKKKFNFSGKRKAKFLNKKNMSSRQLMRDIRSTPEGRVKYNEYERKLKEKMRSTPEGREKNRQTLEDIRSTPQGREKNRQTLENIRSTPQGREKNRQAFENILLTPQGKEKNRQTLENIRSTPQGREKNRQAFENILLTPQGREKNRQAFANILLTPQGKEKNRLNSEQRRDAIKEKINNAPFPPDITDEIEHDCLKHFIRATSYDSLKTWECGICGKAMLNRDYKNELDRDAFDGRELLLKDNQENQDFIDDYVLDDLILSEGGVNGQTIYCCKTCKNSLKNGKLPKFSIANDFQIGKTPPELTDLTLSEKLLISKYRPKMYVVKLRSTYGPHAQQRGLKGNTITFPQDTVKIAANLPEDPKILADHLKVVFIGNGRPSRELLKKVFTVRRQKVYDALNFLIANNPVYENIRLSNDVDIPNDDVPQVIMDTLETHDDLDEDANEHSTYTPQTDLDDIPPDTVVMDSVGLVNLDGSNVQSSDQLNSAINLLQGASSDSDNLQSTMIVPHGSVPVNEYDNPDLWLGAYPWLFPRGRGGPETQRKVKVGLRSYITHILKLADRKFSLDPSFKFHAFNVIQKRDVSFHTSLHVRKAQFGSTASHIQSLTPESMEQLLKCVQDKTPITDPHLKALMDTLSSTGKHINGSPFQKSTYRKEIFGLMIQEGTPVLWITLSPAVTHSPIFLQIAGRNIDISEIPAHAERAKLVANDPVAAAIYFNEIIDAFTKYLLGYKKENGGIFGHPSAYYGMTEEQGTGTLHNHMLVWLHNFKSASKLKSDLEDESFKDELIIYLERVIKQGYLDIYDDDEEINVSEVSCKHPVHPDDANFNSKFKDDVNKLVKVANTHSCRSTCYKYRKTNECRFEFPRELVSKGTIEDGKIKLTRTNEMINNYNPCVMTCIRSNHDVKFIPSGKDGRNIAFYVTNYATKSQLSTHNMVPLIAASKKRLDADPSNTSNSVHTRAKAMITKCLNRITTETEISGSHVSHFLLGNSDNKTSHKFTGLNLHSALAWLATEIKKYDERDEIPLTELKESKNLDKNPDTLTTPSVNIGDDDDDDEDEDTSYTISTGNEGIVLVNQITDYINRGEALNHMCLYDYCSNVYKTKFSAKDLEKNNKKNDSKKSGRQCEQHHLFSNNHPQSETHWQNVRINGMVPTLSKLPPSSKNNKDKYQKCILLLFKPFTSFGEPTKALYNGISWQETYLELLEITKHTRYIDNIDELHIGMDENKENDESDENEDDIVNDVVNDECDENLNQSDETDTGLDDQTIQALEVIQGTDWLTQSISYNRSQQPIFENSSQLPSMNAWKDDMENQNQEKLNDDKFDESEILQEPSSPIQITNADNDNQVEISVESDTNDDKDSVQEIIDYTIHKFNLNKKQKVAFKTAIKNVVKRHNKEQTEQVIGYVGGPGGTGKSQVIKAIIYFHKKMKKRHTLKLSALTGTAAKHIKGSTTTTLFGFSSDKYSNAKLQNKFGKVETIIIDEVSMIGCSHLLKIANALTKGKCADPSLPFGGVDIIFFGDFIQFSPVKDSELYCGWETQENRSKKNRKKQTENNIQLAMHLWKQINHIVILDEQMRVQDQDYLAILNRLREGKCTDSDIALLNNRVVDQANSVTSINDTPIIAPGNQVVMSINDLFVDSHSQCTKVYVSSAYDHIGRTGKVPKKVAKIYKNWANTRTQGLPRELKLFVGMPISITTNIKTELGITNGTSGVVKFIHLKNGEVIDGDTGLHELQQMPDYIIVKLDDIDVKPLDGLPPNCIPIEPMKKSFQVSMSGKQKNVNVNRMHFPLVPRFSCTAHKSQGQTLPKVIIDLVPASKPRGIEFAYVPLSRVRRLEDLTILRPFPPSVLKAKVNEACAAMMEEFQTKDLCKNM